MFFSCAYNILYSFKGQSQIAGLPLIFPIENELMDMSCVLFN